MLRNKEIIVSLLFVVFCFSTVWAEEAKETRTVRTRNPKTGKMVTKQVPVTVPKEADSFENTSVLVEAFMVEVSNDALAEVGVNPIGQAPDGISILKILACLNDTEKAEVISGTKAMACHNQSTKISNNNTYYFKVEQGKEEEFRKPKPAVITRSFTINSCDSDREFEVVPHIQKDDRIRLQANFSYSEMAENEDQMIQPDEIRFVWRGVLAAESGKPVVAGAAQNDESVVFLILTATIQN